MLKQPVIQRPSRHPNRILSQPAGQIVKQIRLRSVGIGRHHRTMGLFRLAETVAAGNPANDRRSNGLGKPLDRPRVFVDPAAVEKNAGQARAVAIEIVDPFENIVGRINSHELL